MEKFKLANSYLDNYKFEEALYIYKELLPEIKEKNPLYYNMAIAYRKLHNFEESIKYLNKCIENDKNYVNAYNALFETYAYFNDYRSAFKYQEWGFGDEVLSHPSLELSKEKRLDWEDSFVKKSLFNRFKCNQEVIETDEKIYNEILNKIENKIIFVRSSQGLGDVIQCSRLVIELLKYKPKKIIFSVNNVIFRLLHQLKNDIIDVRLINPDDSEYDYFIPIFSLIKLLNIDNSPVDSWLKIDEKDLIFGNLIISRISLDKTKIAINWRGNPGHTNDSHRSLTLEQIIDKVKPDGKSQLFSVQINPTDEEKQLMKKYNIIDLSPRINDSYDMGMYLCQMTLFISIDSAPIHLSGSLGIKTFLLIPEFYEDWRWAYIGNNKWYKSLKIFRF